MLILCKATGRELHSGKSRVHSSTEYFYETYLAGSWHIFHNVHSNFTNTFLILICKLRLFLLDAALDVNGV